MVSRTICVPVFITAAVLLFSAHQNFVNCDGEGGSEEVAEAVGENGHYEEMVDHHPPRGESSEGHPAKDPMATASSEDHPDVSSDQNGEHHPDVSSYQNDVDEPDVSITDQNATVQPETSSDQDGDPYEETSGDDGGATVHFDYEIPTEEPDKSGEELLATCKAESNYQGDFSDPNESSQELKCFYACAMLRMDVMMEEDGQISFNEVVADEIVAESLGDNAEMIEKYKSAITACNEEVPKGQDKCEYAYAFITCGIRKLSG